MISTVPPYEHIKIYESPHWFYFVGAVDCSATKFAVLKVDRSSSNQLSLSSGGSEYSSTEVSELLNTIDSSCRERLTLRLQNVFGIVGFVRFLRSYYMILVTKASKMCQLGYHAIYKVDDAQMVYIRFEDDVSNDADEQRYVKAFQSVDLTNNMYFSYTYDLTMNLQQNLLAFNQTLGYDKKYCWNVYLLESFQNFHFDSIDRWVLPIVHGYIKQAKVTLPGCKIGLAIIARRSNKFAGPRFLKRGASLDGFVANEVETEQIAWDMTTSQDICKGRWSSFVQHRGSVPLVWSQDPATRPPVVMGKPPPIQLDLAEPFAQTPSLHFRDLMDKFGSPIVVINLVKRFERRKHESILNDQLRNSVMYLNQFLPPKDNILYVSFDVARCNKASRNVMPKLEEIYTTAIQRTGWFQNFSPLYSRIMRPASVPVVQHAVQDFNGTVQRGIIRTNCVDCLDRTNVAQFVMAKVALGFQLHAMGLLEKPMLPLHSSMCCLLESLYEEHGDNLAQQYAGSQLVHSIKTYKKTAMFQERGRDVIQTLSRYYSNTFADYDKQCALNLFLGMYRPYLSHSQGSLWDLPTDLYLHQPLRRPESDYCGWMLEDDVGWQNGRGLSLIPYPSAPPTLDPFQVYYRTFELTSFDAILNSPVVTRKNLQVSTLDSETSVVGEGQTFVRLWQKRNPDKTKTQQQQKTQEKEESTSSEEEQDNSDQEIHYDQPWNLLKQQFTPNSERCSPERRSSKVPGGVQSVFEGRLPPSTQQTYGFHLNKPSRTDMMKYEKYCRLSGCPEVETAPPEGQGKNRLVRKSGANFLRPVSVFTSDSSFGVALPVVGADALSIYEKAVASVKEPVPPKMHDIKMYKMYANSVRGVKFYSH